MDKAVGDDDDLMAMLEESQNDFEKNKEEKKEEEGDLIEELQKTEKMDKEQTESEEKQETMQNDFMKGFEDLAKNLPNSGPDGGNITEQEMKEAMNMFQNMFKFPQEGDTGKSEEKKEGDAKADGAAGYTNMAKDAKNAGETGGIPGMENLGEMFKDEEFQNFFNNFTQGIFKGGEGSEGGEGGEGAEGGFDPSKMFEGLGTGNPEEMMENMMKEMGGYLEENKDDPEIKNTIDEMMSSLVEKDSIYPSLKLMKDEFPDYLEKNEDNVSVKDLERYNEQLDCIEELCELYETNDKPNKDDVANLLFKLQTFGAPPDELVKKMRETCGANMGALGGMGNLAGLPGMGGMGFPGMPQKK
ncbi:unnamed protein product [Moneuplotes crassus]|uniref:Uncharacterized protein n=1 Tax=Euplotes crassus TaxID=5936 RepID=A0AAD1XIN2_EUPCR|nr:unnamed protein product [Moneuplotes crassus]